RHLEGADDVAPADRARILRDEVEDFLAGRQPAERTPRRAALPLTRRLRAARSFGLSSGRPPWHGSRILSSARPGLRRFPPSSWPALPRASTSLWSCPWRR